ncbi:MAG TPA: hypothetical protein VFP72_05625 [Kineosporiaceae bacterium]|nr:hypothetical protein [Kineosporiaceae bacterium]
MRPLVRTARHRLTRPATPDRGRSRPSRTRLRAIAPALAAAAVATGLAGTAVLPAQASVSATTTGTVRVVISGPTVDVVVPLVSGAPIASSGVHVVVLQGPGVALWSGAATPQLVVRGTVSARSLTLGSQTWTAVDAGDSQSVNLPVLVLRQSRVTGSTFTSPARGQVSAVVKLQHFDPALGRWAPSKRSPAVIQGLRGGRWVNLTTLTTDPVTGTAAGTFPMASGPQQVRVVRPEGATVTGLISAPLSIRVR